MANLEAFGDNVGVLQAYGDKIIGSAYSEVEPLPTTIHTFSDVQKVLNAGKETEKLTVGMEMDEVTVGSEPMVWVIGNISNGEVIFIPKWCLSTLRQVNSTDTTVGGWNSSALRAWLNGDFYNSLPSSVKPYIKDRTFQTSQGNKSTSLQSATDKIWLPREYEIFGATTFAAATEHTDGDAEQFSIFATSSNRIKTQGKTGAACIWWESSPYVSSATYFCIVGASGSAASYGASTACGVLPCFHMTPDLTPSTDTIEITENGSYDVTQYSVADVPGVKLVDIDPNKQKIYCLDAVNAYRFIPVQGYTKLYLNPCMTRSYTYKFVKKDGTETVPTTISLTSQTWSNAIDLSDDYLLFAINANYDAGAVYYSLQA